MKKFLLIVLSILSIQKVNSQSSKLGLKLSFSYGYEKLIGGYVKVREFNLEGTRVNFKDFDQTNYPNIEFSINKSFRKNQGINVQYKRFYLSRNATLDKDIEYNGTIINGRKGIDISPSSYYRFKTYYYGNILNEESKKINYLVGIVYDFLTFYLDGEVSSNSERDEVFEGFYRQAFPYPFIGGRYSMNFTEKDQIDLLIIGSYVPRFKSFFEEGGKVDLAYKTVESEVSYSKKINSFSVGASINFRYMELMQESAEDENIIRTYSVSPIVRLSYFL